MTRLEQGTEVAVMQCEECGNDVKVKVNKNGCLYYVCTAILPEGNRERCFTRKSWGRVSSKNIIKKLMEDNVNVIEEPVEQESRPAAAVGPTPDSTGNGEQPRAEPKRVRGLDDYF